MRYNFTVKSNIHFGSGSMSALSEILSGYAFEKVMIVYDGGVKAAGITKKILAEVEKSETSYCCFDEVIPNPTNEVVEKAARIAKENRVKGLIAIGGGSSIDLAKAVNILMTNPGAIGDYGGINTVKEPCLPLIAIPTMAGTSSEITNVCALIDTQRVVKYVIIDNKIIASDIIADPELTLTMPKSVTAATGMDAITHAMESYISNMATPLTEYHSLKGLKILFENIRRAYEDGSNLDAREQMMLGCIITGFGFSNANLGMVHAIAHTLSAHFAIAHGMANAAVLPYVMEFNMPACRKKMAQIAEAIGLKNSGDATADSAAVVQALKELCDAVGIQTLSQLGIHREDFDVIAADALKEAPLQFNPRQNVSKEDILFILESAY